MNDKDALIAELTTQLRRMRNSYRKQLNERGYMREFIEHACRSADAALARADAYLKGKGQ